MHVHNIHEAKTHFSELIQDVLNGEEVVIAKAGVPVARLIPFSKTPQKRLGGQWKGKIHISADFDELPPDFMAYFSK